MGGGQFALFDPEDLLEWVVEVDEILLRSTGAQRREAMEWWAIHSGRPGIAARTIYLFWAPPGMLLYLTCSDQEEAEFVADYLTIQGLHPRGVTVRRLGRPITCKGCGKRRPFWAKAKGDSRCRPCWNEWANCAHPQAAPIEVMAA